MPDDIAEHFMRDLPKTLAKIAAYRKGVASLDAKLRTLPLQSLGPDDVKTMFEALFRVTSDSLTMAEQAIGRLQAERNEAQATARGGSSTAVGGRGGDAKSGDLSIATKDCHAEQGRAGRAAAGEAAIGGQGGRGGDAVGGAGGAGGQGGNAVGGAGGTGSRGGRGGDAIGGAGGDAVCF